MRKSIFEMMEETFDLHDEVMKIDSMFSKKPYYTFAGTIQDYIDTKYYLRWKYRHTTISCKNIRAQCSIESNDFVYPNEAVFLRFFEFVYNIIQFLMVEYNSDYGHIPEELPPIIDNIDRVLEIINYTIEEIENEKYIIVVKNPSATAVAEMLENPKVIEYNHYLLKGDIQRKRDILKLLAAQFEEVRPNLNKHAYGDLADDTGFLFNNLNIRHPNEKVKIFKQEELECWYDRTYDMFLLCILADHHIELKNDIKSLKTIIGK